MKGISGMAISWKVGIYGVLIAAILASCQAPASIQKLTETPAWSVAELAAQFDYDNSLPLDIRQVSVEDRENLTIQDIAFASMPDRRVSAWLIIPNGAGPFPAVLFMHWGQSNDEFLEEAVALAEKGVVCLVINSSWYEAGAPTPEGDARFISFVIDLRRGLDLLASQGKVDPQRMAYVGHSFGAAWGSVLAGLETRLRAYVLMAGVPRASQKPPYPSAKLDAIHYIGHASPAALYFQFAKTDEYVPVEAAEEFFAAASQPKSISWYEADHALNEQARLDRTQWLLQQLGK